MARHFTELAAWQRAHALRQAVWKVVRRTPDMELRFRAQWTDAARSLCSNIAEGFRRWSHREFVRYLEHSFSPLSEVEDLIYDARMRGHISEPEQAELELLVRRTSAPLARLMRYLRQHPDRPR